ncbi:hypothetical protein G6011_03130 [Alternaria panax]|uniref:Uncharacterized protein n=1 Tax=Alternaria panax TaxID=48097 RepID=A0AAD4IEH4_9PLEO|nr:hypothetical protein G6011_03130 [Alternaria panax]
MSSRTSTVDNGILAAMYTLTRCQARTPSFSPRDTGIKNIEGRMEDTGDVSHSAVPAISVEKRRRMSIGLRNSIPGHGTINKEATEEDEEDIEIEELGALASRATDSIDLIRRDSEKIGTASAKRRMSRKNKVMGWFVGIFHQA